MSKSVLHAEECEIHAEEHEITNAFFQAPAPFSVISNCDPAVLANNWPSGGAFVLWVNGEAMFQGTLS